jgi:hypothetical protein
VLVPLLAIWALGVARTAAQEMPVPVDVQASLLPRILSYERMTLQRMRAGLVIGIVYQSHVRTSLVCAQEFSETIPQFLRAEDGSPVRCMMIEFVSEADLVQHCTEGNVSLIYVTPMRSVDIERIGQLLQSHRLLSYTGVPDYVDAGLVLGVDVQANHPKIVVNLPAARAVGAEFSSQLLRLSRIIE